MLAVPTHSASPIAWARTWCCALVLSLNAHLSTRVAHVGPQAECLWVLRAGMRVLDASVRSDPALACDCWRSLGGTNGVVTLLQQSGITTSPYASPALESVLEIAIGPEAALPGGAAVVLRLLPTSREPSSTAIVATAVQRIERRASSEEEAVNLSKAGVLCEVLRLLEALWQPAAVNTAAGKPPLPGSCEHGTDGLAAVLGASAAAVGGLVPAGAPPFPRDVLRLLVRLAVRLARAWTAPDDLRSMFRAALAPHQPLPEHHVPGSRAALSPGWLALLVSASKRHGPALPYVSLQPPHDRVLIDVPERAWPPAQAYSACYWVRRPLAPDGLRRQASSNTKLALFAFETSDGRSHASAWLRASADGSGATLTLKAGSSLKTATKRVPLALGAGPWHHITIVHERCRPISASRLALYLDGAPVLRTTFGYPAFDCCHTLAARIGYLNSSSLTGATAGCSDDDDDNGDGDDAAMPGVGWQLGPGFVAEVLLSESHVREVCALSSTAPWFQPQTGEAQTDQLRAEALACWGQSVMSPCTPTPPGGEAWASEPASELRLAPAKLLLTVTPQEEDSASSWKQQQITRPRSLAESLPAAGGPSALLALVQHANDSISLVLALTLFGQFLTASPLNMVSAWRGLDCSRAHPSSMQRVGILACFTPPSPLVLRAYHWACPHVLPAPCD